MAQEKYDAAMRIVNRAKDHIRWCIESAASRSDVDAAQANLAQADLNMHRIICEATFEELYEILLPKRTG